jgi:crossover junction endodeoxyribonuclease RuvC
VLTTLGLRGLKVTPYSTSMVKQRVTGGGRADKLQVAAMVTTLLGLPEHPFEDAADALAIALCAAFDSPLQVRTGAGAAALTAPKKPKTRGRDALLALAVAQGKAL